MLLSNSYLLFTKVDSFRGERTIGEEELFFYSLMDFPGGSSGKEPACQCRRRKRCRFDPWVRRISWSRKWQPTPVFLPGKFHGQRRLVGSSP